MTYAVETYKKAQHLDLTDKLVVEMRGHTAVLTLNNPSANTWDAGMLKGVKQLVEHLNQDQDIYALVVTGAGEKFFSAGADLKIFADGDKAMARQMARLFGEAFEALSNYRGVTIAAINGYAWVVVWSVLWLVIFAWPKSRRKWHCQKLLWVYCPVLVVHKNSHGWSVRAGRSA